MRTIDPELTKQMDWLRRVTARRLKLERGYSPWRANADGREVMVTSLEGLRDNLTIRDFYKKFPDAHPDFKAVLRGLSSVFEGKFSVEFYAGLDAVFFYKGGRRW
jgi:hypothetical protein